jgi:hypothetical protein
MFFYKNSSEIPTTFKKQLAISYYNGVIDQLTVIHKDHEKCDMLAGDDDTQGFHLLA